MKTSKKVPTVHALRLQANAEFMSLSRAMDFLKGAKCKKWREKIGLNASTVTIAFLKSVAPEYFVQNAKDKNGKIQVVDRKKFGVWVFMGAIQKHLAAQATPTKPATTAKTATKPAAAKPATNRRKKPAAKPAAAK